MLWLFLALQTMAPFIHAHAGAAHLHHAGFLHAHQGVHSDATWHVMAGVEHGTEVEVGQGMPLRNTIPPTAATHASPAANLAPPRIGVAATPGGGLPAPPPLLRLALPDHTLPHALAPPSA